MWCAGSLRVIAALCVAVAGVLTMSASAMAAPPEPPSTEPESEQRS
jgi:hypothetical protein